MREEIQKVIDDSPVLDPDMEGAKAVLALFCEKVEGIENPYKGKRGHSAQETAFDAGSQAVLELLKEK